MEIKCAYCGKPLEPTPARIATASRGVNLYCNEDCKLRYKAAERGVTESKIIEKLEEIGKSVTLDFLLNELSVRDSEGKKAVMWLISGLRDSGKVRVEKIGDKTVISLYREEVRFLEENFDKLVEMVEERLSKSDRIGEVEKKIEELKQKVEDLEKQIEVLNKKADVLKRAIEVIATALSGRGDQGGAERAGSET